MVTAGSRAIVQTVKAIYSPCKIIRMDEQSITVGFCAGMKKNERTGQMAPDHRKETIPMKDVLRISERL